MIRGLHSSAVLELARPAVAAVAPEELPLLEATASAYLRRGGKGEDELLGFGLDVSVAVVSVAALGAAHAVAEFLGAVLAETVREESSDIARTLVRQRFRRPRGVHAAGPVSSESAEGSPAAAVPGRAEALESTRPLPPHALRQVRRIAYDSARAAGMTTEQAGLIADAIVGRLSIDSPS